GPGGTEQTPVPRAGPAAGRRRLDPAGHQPGVPRRQRTASDLSRPWRRWPAPPARVTILTCTVCRSIPDRHRWEDQMSHSAYVPPRVWTWDKDNGGKFANINRPVAGPTHERELPRGKHPLQLYSLATPNGVKVTIMLEELLELGIVEAEYDAWLIRIQEGDQFGSGFVDINPNSK